MSVPKPLHARARALAGRMVLRMPEAIKLRVIPRTLGYRARDIPEGVRAPQTPVRLLIAPANYAAQAYGWARAVEDEFAHVGARNLEIIRSTAFAFPRDAEVSEHIATLSPRWARRQFRAVRRFSHVLVEAERPILGGAHGGDIVREHRALVGAGVRVAYVSHGSDLRLPSRHAELDEWSPFRDQSWDLLPALETQAAANAASLRSIGAPVFVVTPELLLDYPEATWLPNVVDVDSWAVDSAPLSSSVPRVLHAPTNPIIKGSMLIDPVLTDLAAQGVIEVDRVTRIPPHEMPQRIAAADVVVEQVRLGIYSTTAIEAMASGRVVVGHVSEQVRDHVHRVTGRSVPIVEATPVTLEDVLRDIAMNPEPYRRRAAEGTAFARSVHDGSFSARVLEGFLRS